MGNLITVKNGSAMVKENYKKFEQKAAKIIASGIVNGYVAGVYLKNTTVKFVKEDLKPICGVANASAKRCLKKVLALSKGSAKELGVELKKMCINNKHKIIRVYYLSAVSVAICIVATLMFVGATYLFGNYSFSTERWMENMSDRTHMITSLEKKHDIVGMSRSKIEELLGMPYSASLKEFCEYKALRDCEYDEIVEYRLNSGSMSVFDLVEKHYAIAYKDGCAVWADVIISDVTE